MSRFLGRSFAAGQPASHNDDQQRADDLGGDFNGGGLFAELIDDDHIGDQHAARDPAQQAGPEGNDQRIAVDELEHQRAAPDDDGHADHQAEHHQADLVTLMRILGRARDGNDVVQTHDEVCDDDGLDRRGDGRTAGYLVVALVFGDEQLDADPEQQQGADHLEEGDGEQGQGEGDEDDAQDDGARRAPQYALHAVFGRQVEASQGDDHGVIAIQQDVDQDYLEHGRPAQRLEKFKHFDPQGILIEAERAPAAHRCGRSPGPVQIANLLL